MGFEHVELVVEGHNHWPPMKPPRGQHYERWFHKDGRGEELQRLYETQLEPRSTAMQTFHSALPVAFHNSTWIGDRTIAFINKHSRENFCIWASFPIRTILFDAPEPWSRLHHPDEVDLPPERTLDLERRPWWHRQSLEGKPQIVEHLRKIREQYSRIPVHTDQQLRELIANYYGMISLIDHNVGRIVLELERLNVLHDTAVVYSTDHGDWLGDHGLILKGPMAYEGLLRVGLLFQGPACRKGRWSRIRCRRSTCRRPLPISRALHLRQAQPQLAQTHQRRGTRISPTANGTCAPRAPASTSTCARCARSATSSRWTCAPARASSMTLRTILTRWKTSSRPRRRKTSSHRHDPQPSRRRGAAPAAGRHGMKITQVRAHVLRSALEQPFSFSQGWVSSRGATLVEVQTDEGITGWGEALCQGLQPPEIAAAAINHALKHLVVGEDPLQPEVLWHRMYHYTRDYGQKGAVVGAISGIDIALWDICGKARNTPVAKLLGGMFRTRVEAYATGFYRIKGKEKRRASRRKPKAMRPQASEQ